MIGRLLRAQRWQLPDHVVYAPWTQTQEQELLQRLAEHKGLQVPTGDPVGEVEAVVNHSRWLAECPDDNSAMLLRDGQTTFVCGHCLNKTVDAPRQVTWPDTLPELDSDPHPRNWRSRRT